MNIDLDLAKKRYVRAKTRYYAGTPIMSDGEFDRLEDAIKKKDPKWTELKKTGSPILGKKAKRELIHFMPSLNKFYPEGVAKWLKPSTDYLVMDKLDGSSLQLVYKDGVCIQAITRGDGVTGGDISFLIPYLKIPKTLRHEKGRVVLRCEAVMKESIFKAKWDSAKIGDKGFDNARNGVAGILNRTTAHPALKDTDIVVLGVYDYEMQSGLEIAAKWGFDVVRYDVTKVLQQVKDPAGHLTKLLSGRKSTSKYEMDGLVMCSAHWLLSYSTNDKPKKIVAFKVNTEAETIAVKVIKIIYQVSAHGRINPKLLIEKTKIGGVMVSHATVHNAEWMTSRGIGPGSVVQVVRSGGVIPKVVGVSKKAKPQLPDIPYKLVGKFFFVDKGLVDDATVWRIETLTIAKFMTRMGVDLLAGKTIEFLLPEFPQVESYLVAWHNRTLAKRLENAGIGLKTSVKIAAEFDKVFKDKAVSLKTLMVASHVFDAGIGERKLSLIEVYGMSMDALVESHVSGRDARHLMRDLKEVKGFSDKSASLVIDGLDKFVPMLKMYRRYILVDGSLPKKQKAKGGKLAGKQVAFTSYRDKDHEAAVTAAGGIVGSLGAKTDILLYKEGAVKFGEKIEKARAKGIRVCTFKELGL